MVGIRRNKTFKFFFCFHMAVGDAHDPGPYDLQIKCASVTELTNGTVDLGQGGADITSAHPNKFRQRRMCRGIPWLVHQGAVKFRFSLIVLAHFEKGARQHRAAPSIVQAFGNGDLGRRIGSAALAILTKCHGESKVRHAVAGRCRNGMVKRRNGLLEMAHFQKNLRTLEQNGGRWGSRGGAVVVYQAKAILSPSLCQKCPYQCRDNGGLGAFPRQALPKKLLGLLWPSLEKERFTLSNDTG